MEKITTLCITVEKSIKEAIRKIDIGAKKLLFVVDNNYKLLGCVSDGDIRRWILSNKPLEEKIESIYNKKPKYVNEGYVASEVKDLMIAYSIEVIPVVTEEHVLVDAVEWEELVSSDIKKHNKRINIPAVIMAGGKGTRLDPFTRILPKPLIPIGDKAMIEIIMEEYEKFGIRDFYISINHKGKMIKAYFEENESNYNFTFINEDEPLGTAGALKYLEGKIKTAFFVSNCDILIRDDYAEIFKFHKEGEFSLTMVASMQHHKIPYGVCEINEGGGLKKLIEKPEHDVLVNTGMYVISPDVLSFIPEGEFFNITDLIEKITKLNYKVGVYPVSEKSWVDVGQWEEYRNTVKILSS